MPDSIYDLPEVGALPGWADPDLLANLSLVGLVLVPIAAFLVFRLLRKVLVRVVIVALLVVLGAGLWDQRMELRDCVDDCRCSLFGQPVQIPLDRNPRCVAG